MIYVGVTGKPGSGKTTFSDFLGEKSNVGVIHVDELIDEAKIRFLGPFMTNNKNNKKIKVKPGLKKIVYKSRIAFKFLGFFRYLLVRKSIERKIEEFKALGKDIVVIDDWRLEEHKKLYSKLKIVYFLKRGFCERREGVIKRDQISLDEMNIIDLPYALKHKVDRIQSNCCVIENKGDMESLRQRAFEEYDRIGIKGFDEKYRISDEKIHSQIEMIHKTVLKTGQISKETKEIVND